MLKEHNDCYWFNKLYFKVIHLNCFSDVRVNQTNISMPNFTAVQRWDICFHGIFTFDAKESVEISTERCFSYQYYYSLGAKISIRRFPKKQFSLLSFSSSSCLLLFGLIFYHDDGGDMFRRNFCCLSTDYTALHPRRYNYSLFIYGYGLRILSILASFLFLVCFWKV
jgi:hypothetical protein